MVRQVPRRQGYGITSLSADSSDVQEAGNRPRSLVEQIQARRAMNAFSVRQLISREDGLITEKGKSNVTQPPGNLSVQRGERIAVENDFHSPILENHILGLT